MTGATRVAIIGAGWAGMAAAVELADAGIGVDVFEASRTLGGRARSLAWHGVALDNGQHLLIGAYTECLRLMRKVGVDPEKALLRLPLTLHYPGQFRMVAPRLPAPLHTAAALLFAQGLGWREKWAAIRLMRGLQQADYRIAPDISVAAWLDAAHVPPRQRRFLWEPLCISALNTPAERASAQVMAHVLRDSLGASREASDMLVPRLPLGELFPEPAGRHVERNGERVWRGRRVTAISHDGNAWIVDGERYAKVIVAVAPHHAAALHPALSDAVAGIDSEPIVTVYLRYAAGTTTGAPMLGVGVDGGYAHWVFDHGRIVGPQRAGLMAVVISARGRHEDIAHDELAAAVAGEIAALLPAGTPPPVDTLVIAERRATFSCTPGMRRPATTVVSSPPGLLLAGDYVAGDYPGTLEQAVRTGQHAARTDLADGR